MKICVIHPLKHHVYYSTSGIIKSENQVSVLLGFYDNSKFMRFILRKLGHFEMTSYKYDTITPYVRCGFILKLLFLLAKFNKKFKPYYEAYFNKKGKKYIDNSDVAHFLQDYCNDLIRYAKNQGKIIVYEQIIAFFPQRYFLNKLKPELTDKEHKELENLQMADYILSPSKFVTESLLDEQFGTINLYKKIREIPYGVDINQFKPNIQRLNDEEKLNMICVAAVSIRKGTNYLVDAMNRLEGYNIRLTYIGLAEGEGAEGIVRKLRTSPNIEYLGRVSHTEIQKYYSMSNVFVLPSLAEGSSLSIYEAMASGLACIITNNSGSVIKNNKDGIIINPHSTDEIEDKILELYSNREKLYKLQINARKTAEKYTWNSFEDKITNFYKAIIK